jgi:hypothetical protein
MNTPSENIFRLDCEAAYFDRSLAKINLDKINKDSLFTKSILYSLSGFMLECISYYMEYMDSADTNYISAEEFQLLLDNYNSILDTNIYIEN